MTELTALLGWEQKIFTRVPARWGARLGAGPIMRSSLGTDPPNPGGAGVMWATEDSLWTTAVWQLGLPADVKSEGAAARAAPARAGGADLGAAIGEDGSA